MPQTPTVQFWITQALRTFQCRGVSRKGKDLFSITQYGGEGGRRIYIGEFVEHPPSRSSPWVRSIDDEWRSVLHSHSGRPPYEPLSPCHPQNGENTKAWDWIADDNSDLNEWPHLWAMRKSTSLMENTIIDGGNGEKIPLYLERDKTCLERMKTENRADSSSIKWMILHT